MASQIWLPQRAKDAGPRSVSPTEPPFKGGLVVLADAPTSEKRQVGRSLQLSPSICATSAVVRAFGKSRDDLLSRSPTSTLNRSLHRLGEDMIFVFSNLCIWFPNHFQKYETDLPSSCAPSHPGDDIIPPPKKPILFPPATLFS